MKRIAIASSSPLSLLSSYSSEILGVLHHARIASYLTVMECISYQRCIRRMIIPWLYYIKRDLSFINDQDITAQQHDSLRMGSSASSFSLSRDNYRRLYNIGLRDAIRWSSWDSIIATLTSINVLHDRTKMANGCDIESMIDHIASMNMPLLSLVYHQRDIGAVAIPSPMGRGRTEAQQLLSPIYERAVTSLLQYHHIYQSRTDPVSSSSSSSSWSLPLKRYHIDRRHYHKELHDAITLGDRTSLTSHWIGGYLTLINGRRIPIATNQPYPIISPGYTIYHHPSNNNNNNNNNTTNTATSTTTTSTTTRTSKLLPCHQLLLTNRYRPRLWDHESIGIYSIPSVLWLSTISSLLSVNDYITLSLTLKGLPSIPWTYYIHRDLSNVPLCLPPSPPPLPLPSLPSSSLSSASTSSTSSSSSSLPSMVSSLQQQYHRDTRDQYRLMHYNLWRLYQRSIAVDDIITVLTNHDLAHIDDTNNDPGLNLSNYVTKLAYPSPYIHQSPRYYYEDNDHWKHTNQDLYHYRHLLNDAIVLLIDEAWIHSTIDDDHYQLTTPINVNDRYKYMHSIRMMNGIQYSIIVHPGMRACFRESMTMYASEQLIPLPTIAPYDEISLVNDRYQDLACLLHHQAYQVSLVSLSPSLSDSQGNNEWVECARYYDRIIRDHLITIDEHQHSSEIYDDMVEGSLTELETSVIEEEYLDMLEQEDRNSDYDDFSYLTDIEASAYESHINDLCDDGDEYNNDAKWNAAEYWHRLYDHHHDDAESSEDNEQLTELEIENSRHLDIIDDHHDADADDNDDENNASLMHSHVIYLLLNR
jgi:hypothetical protein